MNVFMKSQRNLKSYDAKGSFINDSITVKVGRVIANNMNTGFKASKEV